MAIRTILAAVAPDGDGAAVAGRAAQLAKAHGARLLLLRVLEELPVALPVGAGSIDGLLRPEALANLRDEALAGLRDEALAVLRQLAAGTAAELLLETGKAHQAIDDAARRSGADLLLIGPGRPRNLREKMFGSTADRLIRATPCPLLLVKQPVAEPYRRVVCGLDFSAESRLAARMAARLAPMARLTLLHVVEVPLSFEQALLKSGVPGDEIDRYRKGRLLEARRRLRREFADEFPPPVVLRVAQGEAAQLLVRASRGDCATLLAIGAQGAGLGEGRVAERLLGSVARKVLLRAASDVLLIPG